jgi:glycolate oxidase FAD binding subunit
MATEEALTPTTEAELCEIVSQAAGDGVRLAIRGGASKSEIGRATPEARMLDLRGFAGVVDYDPSELVLTARPGTLLADIETLVAQRGQRLAFDPFDHGPIFGRAAGMATLGGVIAAGVAGSRRVSAGAARDHLLGFRAVSGRGELFVGGGKVVKNVTGYDLPKLMAGSWGRLAALTEVTLKVLPAPRVTMTLVLAGLDPSKAVAAMAAAMGSAADVAAAAHVPLETPRTLFRLQGFQASVAARAERLAERLADFGRLEDRGAEGESAWTGLQTLSPLPGEPPLWRIIVPPAAGADIAARLDQLDARWMLDWAGGLVWAAGEADPDAVRAAARAAGGHAQLVRGPAELRARIPAFHPPDPAQGALEERLRRAFDPQGVFETGRF